MECKKCGAQLMSDDTFCKKCATSIYDVNDIDEQINNSSNNRNEILNINTLSSIIKINPQKKYKVTNQNQNVQINNKDLINKDQNDMVKASVVNIGGTILILVVFIIIVIVIINMFL